MDSLCGIRSCSDIRVVALDDYYRKGIAGT